jgi:hypothetical protein
MAAVQFLHCGIFVVAPYMTCSTTKDKKMFAINLLTSVLLVICGASLVGYIAYVGALA